MAASSSLTSRSWTVAAAIRTLCVNHRGDVVALSLADGTARLWPADDTADQPAVMPLFDKGPFCLTQDADAHAFLCGGPDGRVLIIDPEIDAPTEIMVAAAPITVVAGSHAGYRAVATGSTVHLLDPEGQDLNRLTVPAAVTCLAFDPSGNRLAIGYEGGLAWAQIGSDAAPVSVPVAKTLTTLLWESTGRFLFGAAATGGLWQWSPDDQTTAAFQAAHQSQGPMALSPRDRYLIAGGAYQALGWPLLAETFWNQIPQQLGPRVAHPVRAVAPHPKDPLIALGYADGLIVLAPLDGRLEMTLRPPQMNSGVIGMGWNAFGDCLFAATENQQIILFATRSQRGTA